MQQLIYIVGFIILMLLANHFMKKVKNDTETDDHYVTDDPEKEKDPENTEILTEINEEKE